MPGPLHLKRAGVRCPWDVALDGGGKAYVTDTGNHRIEAFTTAGS